MGAGGQQFSQPTFDDAVPKGQQPNQGGMAGVNYVDENTFSGAEERVARMDQNSTVTPDQQLRGFRPTPTGGTYNPGQSKGSRASVSATQSGPTETAPGNYVS